MSLNSILATAPLTTQNFVLKANGTTIGNSLIFDNGTNVGIGNTNTSYTLDVSGTGNFTGALSGTSAIFSSSVTATTALLNSTTNQLVLQNTAGGSNAEKVALFMTGGDTFKLISLNDNNTTRVDNILVANVLNGNVGIGTSSPIALDSGGVNLQIKDRSALFQLAAVNSTYLSNNIYYDGSWKRIVSGFGALIRLNDDSNGFSFLTTGTGGANSAVTFTSAMNITNAGNVGIGTVSPNERLYVYNNAGTNPAGTVISVETAGSTSGYGAEVKLINSNSSGRTYGIRSSGPGDGLVGSYKFAIIDYTANAGRLIIDSSGVVTISNLGSGGVTATSGVLSTTSDMTLKIEDGFIDNALEKVMKLTPRYFHWKEESGLPTDIRQLGFYAQEVNAALGEEAANTPKTEDDKWGIYDRALIAMLTKAVQELRLELNELKNK